MAIKDTTDLLKVLCHTQSQDDADYVLRSYHMSCQSREIAATGTVYQLIGYVEKTSYVKKGYVIPDTTQAANAASRDYALVYDDGAGGGYTVVGTEIDGTAAGVTADQASSLVAASDVFDQVPAGSFLYLRTTANTTGVALSLCAAVVLEYV